MRAGIYMIKNVESGKFYVGSAVNIKARWQSHISAMRASRHANQHLQRAWNKYGHDAFLFSVLEHVSDLDCLLEREQYWIDFTDAVNIGYNVCPTAGNALGRKMQEETKRRIGLANTGRQKTAAQIELHAQKLRGRKHGVEAIAKMSKARKGITPPPHVMEKAQIGFKLALIEKKNSGEFFSEESAARRMLSQLSRRTSKNNTSGITGVRRCSRSTEHSPAWTAEIRHAGKKIFVGRFPSLDAAIAARQAKAEEIRSTLAEKTVAQKK